MKEKLLKPKAILIAILLIAAFLRLYRLNYPNQYVFDEVYHGFTAQEYAKWNLDAWVYWTTPPPGVAYEWTHPPLAKEIMALSIHILPTTDYFAFRLPGVLFNIFAIYLVYLITRHLFKKESIALLAAFLFSIDGLNFVQSRTAMNDIYLVTFLLGSFYLFLKQRFLFSAIIFGLAISSKWSAVYYLGIVLIPLLLGRRFKEILYFIFIPPLIYFISYTPFFMLGNNLEQFKNLQQQMWWYHTGLKATHDYTSPWWSWPFNLYPVWYFVEYFNSGVAGQEKMANIFASGNLVIFWGGIVAVIYSLKEVITKKNTALVMLLLGYFAFIVPWALSPRIMFLYHYAPCIPFLTMILAYQISKFRNIKEYSTVLPTYVVLAVLMFGILFPYLTGLPIDRSRIPLVFQISATKNPFGDQNKLREFLYQFVPTATPNPTP